MISTKGHIPRLQSTYLCTIVSMCIHKPLSHFAKPSPFNPVEWGGFGKVGLAFIHDNNRTSIHRCIIFNYTNSIGATQFQGCFTGAVCCSAMLKVFIILMVLHSSTIDITYIQLSIVHGVRIKCALQYCACMQPALHTSTCISTECM